MWCICCHGQDGRTPLLVACANGHVDVAGLLLERGAGIDVRDKVSPSMSRTTVRECVVIVIVIG